VFQDIGRCSRGVARDYKPVTNDYLSECGRQGFEQLKCTGHPGLETRRRFCNPAGHVSLYSTLSLSFERNQACMALLRASLHNGCRYPLA
jgi:hypothetical protein